MKISGVSGIKMLALLKGALSIILILLLPGCFPAIYAIAKPFAENIHQDFINNFKLKKPLSDDRSFFGGRTIIVTHFLHKDISAHDQSLNMLQLSSATTYILSTEAKAKRSEIFSTQVKKQLDQAEYANKLAGQIEKAFKDKGKGQILVEASLSGGKKYIVKDGDSMLEIELTLSFGGEKPQMRALMKWYASRSAVKHQEITERRNVMTNEMDKEAKEFREGKIKGKDLKGGEIAKQYKALLNQYDAGDTDTIVYISTPFTSQEWLENNGALLKQELDKAIVQLSMQLGQTLSPGRSN